MEVFKSLAVKFPFRGSLSFVGRAQNTIISAAVILAISSGATYFLSLFKGRFLTAQFGVSDELGIFYTADRIPNLIYSILVVGAISTVFIPIFTELQKKNREDAWKTASAIIAIGVFTFVFLGLVVSLLAYQIIDVLAVGRFSDAQIRLGANLMKIMIGAQLILVISSFVTSILQSFKYFVVPALAPLLYNIGMIFGILVLSPRFGIYGPALGIVLGSTLHLLIQLPLLKKLDFRFSLSKKDINGEDQNIKKMVLLMPPRILSVVSNQLVATINNSLAIIVSTASVVILKFGTQLQFFPVHLFGVSMASAALPVLSEHSDISNPTTLAKFKRIFITTLHQTLFLVMPVSMILLVLRIPVVRLVYGVDNFPWEATIKTSYTLAFFSISIFAQAAVYLITRAFYALKDTTTPVKVSLVTIVLNVSLSLFFVKYMGFGVWAIALSYSITSILDSILMTYLLARKLGGFSINELLTPFIKVSYATLFMGISLYIPLKLLDQLVFDTTRTINLIFLTGITGVAGVVSYLVFTWLFKVEEIELFYKLLRRFKIATAKQVVQTEVREVVADQREGI